MDQRLERSPLPAEVLLAALVALAVIATVPDGYAPRWSARAFLYLVAAPAGSLALVRLARAGDRSARIGVAFVVVATVSALLSASPARSLLHAQYRHESVVFFAAGFGVWAIARRLPASGKALVQWAFVGSVLFSVLVGVVQLVAGIESGPLGTTDRASGLSLNPVYLGALAAASAAWCARSMIETAPGRWYAASLAVSSLGVWISGSRVALLALLLVVAAALARAERRCAVVIGGAALAGIALGGLVRRVASIGESGELGTTGRLSGGAVASGLRVRLEVWGFDLRAFLKRPLLGHGPGRHTNAIESHYTPDFVARTDPDQFLNGWTDAHNVVLELLVVVGVVGLILAVAFVASQFRSLQGPAAWAVGAACLTWLMQPVGEVTLIPVAALLGAAAHLETDVTVAELTGVGRAGLATVSVVVGLWFVASEAALGRADSVRSLDAAERAASLWWHDPLAAHDAAVFGAGEGLADLGGPEAARVLALAAEATDREPDLAYWWIRRGDFELIFDERDAARDSFDRALSLQPWSRAAMLSLLGLLDPVEDAARVDELSERLARVDEPITEAGG